MFLIILGIIAIICGVGIATQSAIVGVIVIALGVLLIVLGAKRRKAKRARKAAAAAAAPAAPAAPTTQAAPTAPAPAKTPDPAYNFRIAGVTFEGRQRILKGIANSEDKYTGTFHIDQIEYQGAPAFRVTLMTYDDDGTEYDIGRVPAALVNDILAVYDRITHVSVSVYGGYDGKSYGAAATVYYRAS